MRSSPPAVPVFGPEEIDVMHAAFVAVCGKLGLKPGDPAADDIAVWIVDFAVTGIRDIEGLTTATLAEFIRCSSINWNDNLSSQDARLIKAESGANAEAARPYAARSRNLQKPWIRIRGP
jgi:hypothetical protein